MHVGKTITMVAKHLGQTPGPLKKTVLLLFLRGPVFSLLLYRTTDNEAFVTLSGLPLLSCGCFPW